MSDIIKLEAQHRTVKGKQVKQLRAQELIPAVIFGPKLEQSIEIQVPQKMLSNTLRKAGATNLLEIDLGDSTHNVLVRDVQRDIFRGDLIHVDFYAVSLDTKITTEVPVVFTGESEIVVEGQAILITRSNTIEVSCLPTNIPEELTLDISRLSEIGDYLTVADLNVPEEVEILAEPDEVLVRTDYAEALPVEEEEEEEDEFETVYDADDVEVIKRGKEDEEIEE